MADFNLDSLDSEIDNIADGISDSDSSISGASGGESSGSSSGALALPNSSPVGGQTATQPAGTAPYDYNAPPKSWKSDYHKDWTALPENVRQYVYQREKEQLDGLTGYKTQVDTWNQVLEPYQQLFQQANVDPHQVTQRMLDAHVMLTYGDEQQKREWGQYLVQSYGLEGLLAAASGNPAQQLPEQFTKYEKELQDLKQWRQSQEQREHQTRLAEANDLVAKFVADPKNEFAQEVLPDMVRLMRHGLAKDIQSAYTQATRLNESVAAKLLQRQLELTSRPQRRGPQNVDSHSEPAPTVRSGTSWESDLEENADKLYQRNR